ncbi:MAG: hypothetical protein KME04_15585 [Pleurocapsa minor GSE-CHR-MK-17-07R]|jgi:hypothetical protein|nr:hypothetical protein [Pleurocapsa minor GSE-CHR-MK 17-07R]
MVSTNRPGPLQEHIIATQRALETLFDFTEADLAANRAGVLSEIQRERLRQQLYQASISSAAFTLSLPVIFVFAVAFMAFSLRFGDDLGPGILCAIGVWFLLTWALYTLAYAVMRRLLPVIVRGNASHPLLRRVRAIDNAGSLALEQGIVERVAGRLGFPSDGEHEYVMLDDVELTNSVAADEDERLWQLVEGAQYALYFVQGGPWIVSVERLETL